MIISDFYQTKIEVVKSSATSTPYYNVNIDANDVLVIVSLIDFNGSPVVGRDVTLTVDRGSFTGVASGVSSSPSGSVTSSTSCHATTDSNGKISALYTASEWGLATFSTNNNTVQVEVKGWKSYTINAYTVRYNEHFVEVSVAISSAVSFPGSWSDWTEILTTSPDLRPKMPVVFWDSTGKIQMKLTDISTKIAFHSASNSQITQTCYGMVTYSRT